MDPNFQNWQFNIGNGISITNTNGTIMASKNVNTSFFKSTYQYTIYIHAGHVYIWVKSNNMPCFIELDIIHPSLIHMNTPQPNKTYGRPVPGRSGHQIEPHRCIFII